jgi:hypothetical protein
MRKVASDLIARLVPRYFRPHMDYARLRVASVSRFYRMEFISLLLVLAEITAGTPAAAQTSFRHPKAGPRPKPGTDVTAERFDPNVVHRARDLTKLDLPSSRHTESSRAVKQRLVLHEVFLKFRVGVLHGCPMAAHLKGLFRSPPSACGVLALGRPANKS